MLIALSQDQHECHPLNKYGCLLKIFLLNYGIAHIYISEIGIGIISICYNSLNIDTAEIPNRGKSPLLPVISDEYKHND